MHVEILGRFDPVAPPLRLPLYLARVAAGFPSPADDYAERRLSLDEYVVDDPDATYFVRVEGDSMEGAGIRDGDLLVVDSSREVVSGDIVVAVLNGEMTVKRVRVRSWRGGGRRACGSCRRTRRSR